jgi:cyclopropane-fatty-acyl-phospholipid synthase
VIDRLAGLVVRTALRRLGHGSVTIVDTLGRRFSFGADQPAAIIELRDERTWRAFLGGSVKLGDSYADGFWDSPDLVAAVRVGAQNMPTFDRWRHRLRPVVRPLQLIRAAPRPRGIDQSRRDIAAHYDLGNDLFSLMLDPSLTYSCGIFESPHTTLEQAQMAKLRRVCEKLMLGHDDRVLEIGSGWGSLAMFAAGNFGCHVTTTTISREQYEHVTAAVADANLEDRVTVLFEDYRNLTGRFDRLVSIEMIEAVGWRDLGVFLARCADLLEPSGAMLLQAILIDEDAYEVEKASRSFIKEFIFPGASLASLPVLTGSLARHTDLRELDLDDITEHYVETLSRWREGFAASAGELAELGYDTRFQRIWDLYLAYCEAGFAERRITDVQLLLAKPHYTGVREPQRDHSGAVE